MSLLSGIACLKRPLSAGDKARFLSSLEAVRARYPWPLSVLEGPHAVLAAAGFGRLWQGPVTLSGETEDIAVIGVQSRPLPGKATALGTLARCLASGAPVPAGGFERFHLAVLDKREQALTLAVDPLGLDPLCHTLVQDTLVFSSHQTHLRRFLGERAEPDDQAAFEFLVIGHLLGDKTLMKGASVLPPGHALVFREGGVTISSYAKEPVAAWRDRSAPTESALLSRATDAISRHMEDKVRGYAALCDLPVTGLLSGGWDSRYLAALFSAAGRMTGTWTTQQRILREDRLVSEKALAREVAETLGLENRFVAPVYRTPETLADRTALLDHATWFHDWAFAMASRIPEDQGLLADGLLGDILFRDLYGEGIREETAGGGAASLAEALHRQYLGGFNTYTRGVDRWRGVLDGDRLAAFSDRLMQDLEQEIRGLGGEDPVSGFLLRNRTRRGIAPLPALLFGSRGDVLLPFCDAFLLRTVLALPPRVRFSGALYRALLERARPGLAAIPSTHETDEARLAPYLLERTAVPEGPGKTRSQSRMKAHVKALCRKPPRVLMGTLNREVREALRAKDEGRLMPHRFELEKIGVLEAFWRSGEA